MKDILIAARAKIANPAHWTQHVLARDANGNDKPDSHLFANYVHWEGLTGDDPMACKWCALGAVEAVAGADTPAFRAARRALDKVSNELFKMPIAELNDDTEEDHEEPELAHIDVLAVFDKAIAQL